MNIERGWMNPVACRRWIALTLLALGILGPLQAQSQVPPRFYWKTLSGANAVPLIASSMSGNTNPFDPAHTVVPGATFDGTLALAGYTYTFTLFDRSAMAAVLLPMGRLSGLSFGLIGARYVEMDILSMRVAWADARARAQGKRQSSSAQSRPHWRVSQIKGSAGPPVSGRAALLGLARSMKPIASATIRSDHIEGSGNMAYSYGIAMEAFLPLDAGR